MFVVASFCFCFLYMESNKQTQTSTSHHHHHHHQYLNLIKIHFFNEKKTQQQKSQKFFIFLSCSLFGYSFEFSAEPDGEGEESERARLVERGKVGRHVVQESCNAQSDLDKRHGDECAEGEASSRRQRHAAQRRRVQANGADGGYAEHSVLELDGGRVLEEVAPHRFVSEQVAGYPAVGHLGERVVNKSGVEAGHERARHRRREYERHQVVRSHRDATQVLGLNAHSTGNSSSCGALWPKMHEARPEEAAVEQKCRAEVSGEAILADARHVRLLLGLVEARLDHVPAEEALEAE